MPSTTLIDFDDIILNEQSHLEKDRFYVILLHESYSRV